MEKIYRLPSVRQAEQSKGDLHQRSLDGIADLCIGKSISKPNPPLPFQLKRESRSKKAPSFGRENKRLRKNPPHGSTLHRSLTMASAVYKNEDVLSSLKKLNLLEPFLNDKHSRSRPADAPLTLSKPVQFSMHWIRESDGPDEDDNTPNSDSGIDQDFAPRVQQVSSGEHKSSETSTSLSRSLLTSFDQSTHSLRDRDSRVDDKASQRPAHAKSACESNVTASLSSNDIPHSSLDKSPLSQNFHGRKPPPGIPPPTATLVDITTGGIVDQTSGYVVIENDGIAQSANVPPSFYYNKRKKRKVQDRELDALKKVPRSFDDEPVSDVEEEEKLTPVVMSVRSKTQPVMERKQSVQPKRVTFPPSLPETPMNPSSRSNSVLSTTSSVSSCERRQPRAPNPTPHLDDNRFQIFATAIPNTYHVYSGSRGQPTVISVEDIDPEQWLRSRESMRRTQNVRNKRTAPGGFRIAAASSRQKRETSPGALDALVQGCSMSVKNAGALANADEDLKGGDFGEVTSLANRDTVVAKEDDKSRNLPVNATSSSNSENEDSDAVKSRGTRQSTSIFTPLNSLTVRPCRPGEPLVVVSKDVSGLLSDVMLPEAKGSVPGHLSPLKGVRLLRRKITIKHRDNLENSEARNASDTEKESGNPVLVLMKHLNNNSKSAEKLLKKINFGSNNDLSHNMIMPRKENTSLVRARKSSRLKAASTQSSAAIEIESSMPVNCSINVEKLCLEGDPYFMLKEGNSQSLNFLDSYAGGKATQLHMGATKNERKRRIMQLGAVKVVDDKVHVKIAAGGGFRSNGSQYSLLQRQRQFQQQLKEQEAANDARDDDTDRCEHLDEGISAPLDHETSPNREPIGRPAIPRSRVASAGSPRRSSSAFHDNVFSPLRMSDLTPAHLATFTTTSDLNFLSDRQNNVSSAAVLPDPTTSSYRITNDVSFDEGSRYNGEGTATQFNADRKNTENIQRLKHNSSTESRSSPYNGHGRLEKLSDSPIRDRANHGTPTAYKEAMPMSLVRMEDRVEFDAPLRRHSGHGAFVIPGSRGHSAQAGAHATVPVVASTSAALSLTTFRLQKGKQNWNSRSGDLSVSGGGYYGSSPMQPGARVDMVGMGSLSISPASNFSPKLGPNRERNGTLTKTRVSSRFGCRMDSMGSLVGPAGREGHYADPCLSAPPSFQQRLMELSMLETETVKYERNRKLKRKKAQDS